MPDRRVHRGPHPHDARLFGPDAWPTLRQAVRDLAWLLSHGYAEPSALKLVGDHFQLDQRQRTAIMRSACSDQCLAQRLGKQAPLDQLAGADLALDGYNVLTTVEAALAGGFLLLGRDGCLRDLAGIHGTWRKVQETVPAAELIGRFLAEPVRRAAAVLWYLDRPVSNSGRLKTLLRELAGREGWPWQVELVYSPDGLLAHCDLLVATADSEILNRCPRWVNLARELIAHCVLNARIIDLSGGVEESRP